MQHLEVSGAVVLYTGRTVSKGNPCCQKPTNIRLKSARTSRNSTVELGYNVMKRTKHFVAL
jgi:hypothetical protein